MSTICKTCGGPVNRVGNYYICEYCRNKWEIDSGNDVHAVDRANAWSALRDGDFEKAAELFENIIVKEAKNHEAYWGRALALAGIVYVTDMNENKKVPTCNNITEDSFINNKDVQKAISLAPADIADGYKQQAEYIEKVRIEWLEKASKEPAYDVFISFKDSDRENGIERTQDSIDAQDLYNALVAEGYKVFFSRISLRDKIAEQYEPYIYNAIKTAKVMIVFGEKAEYFNSVWIKNEWSRFKTRIEKAEKHKNSLVVVYKNMNPGDLPVVLKSRQCLNASDMTFFSDLTRHIKRVVEESKRNVHLEKIEIAGGQIAKKASNLAVNSVQTREIGAGVIAETSISEKQTLSLIISYLDSAHWQEAINLADDVLFDNPSCAEAIWYKLLAAHQVSANSNIIEKLEKFNENDYKIIEKVLNCASKEFAEEILILLYDSEKEVSGEVYKKVLDTILPFSFSKRQSKINSAFTGVISRSKYQPFKVLLNTLKSSDVDKYINYNYKYALQTFDSTEKIECLNNVLKVDEGNVDALRAVVNVDLETGKPAQKIIADFELLLKYTNDTKQDVLSFLGWLSDNLSTAEHCVFAKQLLRYYPEEIATIREYIKLISYKMIEKSFFTEAEYFLNLMLTINSNDTDAYWGICLVKLEATSENDIVNSKILIQDVSEFNKYLTFVDENRRKECLHLLDVQKVSNYRKKSEVAQHLIWDKGYLMVQNIHTLDISYIDYKGSETYYDQTQIFKRGISKLKIKHIWAENVFQTIDDKWFYVRYPNRQSCVFDTLNYPQEGLCFFKTNGDFYNPGSEYNYACAVYNDGTIKTNFSDEYRLFLNYENKPLETYVKHFFGRKDLVQICRDFALRNDGRIENKNGELVKGIDNAIQLIHLDTRVDMALLQSGKLVAFSENAIQDYNSVIEMYDKHISNSRDKSYEISCKNHFVKLAGWTDIVALKADTGKTIGIKKDGSVVLAIDYSTGNKNCHTHFSNAKCFNNFDTIIEDYEESIRKHLAIEKEKSQMQAQTPTTNQNVSSSSGKQGCYIATCVYGSYDCPEVWTLRRFRDDTLRSTWYGRLFVKFYYFISPKLVAKFGEQKGFKSLCKRVLDRFVNKLELQGFENSPYQDK